MTILRMIISNQDRRFRLIMGQDIDQLEKLIGDLSSRGGIEDYPDFMPVSQFSGCLDSVEGYLELEEKAVGFLYRGFRCQNILRGELAVGTGCDGD